MQHTLCYAHNLLLLIERHHVGKLANTFITADRNKGSDALEELNGVCCTSHTTLLFVSYATTYYTTF